jgi:hypothetical protein
MRKRDLLKRLGALAREASVEFTLVRHGGLAIRMRFRSYNWLDRAIRKRNTAVEWGSILVQASWGSPVSPNLSTPSVFPA